MLNENSTKPDYLWSNKDIMTIDSLPFIGYVNDNRKLLIATGYNTWGMTNGILAGKILSDMIMGKDNKYIDLFNPKALPNITKTLIQKFKNELSKNCKSGLITKLVNIMKMFKAIIIP